MTEGVVYDAAKIGQEYLKTYNEPSTMGDAWQGIQNTLGKYVVGPIKGRTPN